MSNLVIDEKAMLEAEEAYNRAYWEYEVAKNNLTHAGKILARAIKKMELYVHD